MNKIFKKISAVTLGVGMLLTTSVPAFAMKSDMIKPPINISNPDINYVHYDYDIPSFNLSKSEQVCATRHGYGFSVDKTGSNHNDFDISFAVGAVNGRAVKMEVFLITLEDYVNGDYSSKIKSKEIIGAGKKSFSFYNLNQGIYVIGFKNIANDGTELKVTSVNLDTSY